MYNPLESNLESTVESKSDTTGSNDVEERAADTLLEAYLDRLCAPLTAELSREETLDLRFEMRSHIQALASAHGELGARPVEAMREALRQFGAPVQIGRQIRCERTVPDLRVSNMLWALLASLIGAVIGRFGAQLAIRLLLWQGILPEADDPAFGMIGFCLGLVTGGALWLRWVRPGLAARYAGISHVLGFIAIVCGISWTMNRPIWSQPWDVIRAVGLMTALYGVEGTVCGGVMSWVVSKMRLAMGWSRRLTAR